MSEKQASKPKAEKPEAKAKAPAAKAAAPKAAKKEAKAAPSGATITVTQTGSAIGRRRDQEATLIGLGLNKKGRTRTLQDTPAVRGMINKIAHLVKVQKA